MSTEPSRRALTVRMLAPADIDAVAALARRVWHSHYPGIISVAQIEYMLAERYAPERIAAELGDPGIAWRVAEVDGWLAGYASTHHRGDGELKLDKIYVDLACQRRGVGRALLDDALATARGLACATLILAVNRHNAKAIAFYRARGFEFSGTRVADIGGGFMMDDFIMRRAVDHA